MNKRGSGDQFALRSNVHVRRYGEHVEGVDPIVAFNGAGFNNNQWGDFLDNLGGEVYAVDPRVSVSRKLGASAFNPFLSYPVTMEDYALTTSRAIDEMQEKGLLSQDREPDAVTLSWGGMLAAKLKNRGSVDRVVAFSAPRSGIELPDLKTQTNLVFQSTNWMLGTVMSKKIAAELHGIDDADEDKQIEIIHELTKKLNLEKGLERDLDAQQLAAIGYESLKGYVLGASYDNIADDFLVVHGGRDRLTPPYPDAVAIRSREDLVNLSPDIKAAVLPDDGHLAIHTSDLAADIAVYKLRPTAGENYEEDYAEAA